MASGSGAESVSLPKARNVRRVRLVFLLEEEKVEEVGLDIEMKQDMYSERKKERLSVCAVLARVGGPTRFPCLFI